MRKAAQKAGLLERQEDSKRMEYRQENIFKITDQGPLVRALRRKALQKDEKKKPVVRYLSKKKSSSCPKKKESKKQKRRKI